MNSNPIHVSAFKLAQYFQMKHSAAFGEKKNRHAAAWQEFCSQPMAVKRNHSFGFAGGYEYKDENNLDYKEDFHVSLRYLIPANATDIDRKYINSGKELIHEALPFVKYAAQVASEVAQCDFVKDVVVNHEKWQLRDLHYFPRLARHLENDPILLAVSHVDKGLTIHLMEDAEGFEVLSLQDEWEPVELEENSLLVYGGLDAQYYSQGRIIAKCHRVRATQKTEQLGRHASVVFAGFGTMKYDKQTHGKTQIRFGKGENYRLSHAELSAMFISEELVVI